MKTVALVGTMDTKGDEYAFVKDILESRGLGTLTIHCGVYDAACPVDIGNATVARAAGADIAMMAKNNDRGSASAEMAKGMSVLLPKLYAQGRFDGVLGLGGSGGTTIATAGMRELPVGVPKMMVSTIASGDVSMYVGISDIIMYPSIVDIAGINPLSIKIFTNAAFAMAGMLGYEYEPHRRQRPLVAATMFGVTTPCVEKARKHLEDNGYEVVVFHATGTGGMAMEKLIGSGFFTGVLDLTTTELCDELAGGVLSAGPERMEAAGRLGIPQVVSPGAIDMVNFQRPETVPEEYRNRTLYFHNPNVTLMRTTVDENAKLGEILAGKLNMARGPTVLMLPLGGFSAIDREGQPFYGYEEDMAFIQSLKRGVKNNFVRIEELDCNINDSKFALAAAKNLIELIEGSRKEH